MGMGIPAGIEISVAGFPQGWKQNVVGLPRGWGGRLERYFKEFPRNVAVFDFYSASESTNEFTVHFFSMQNIGCRA